MIKSEGNAHMNIPMTRENATGKECVRKGCARSQEVNKLETGTKFFSFLPKWLLTIFVPKCFI